MLRCWLPSFCSHTGLCFVLWYAGFLHFGGILVYVLCFVCWLPSFCSHIRLCFVLCMLVTFILQSYSSVFCTLYAGYLHFAVILVCVLYFAPHICNTESFRWHRTIPLYFQSSYPYIIHWVWVQCRRSEHAPMKKDISLNLCICTESSNP